MIINNAKVQQKIKENAKEKHKVLNFFKALFFGGLIGMLGQAIYSLFYYFTNLNEVTSTTLVSVIFVVFAFLLTCFGLFDKMAQVARCGLLIPITGFANSITSSALEGKAEGPIFGVGSKMFSLVGSVTTYGIVSAIILGFIYFVMRAII